MTKVQSVIEVNGVCKDFKLPHEKTTTLKGAFTSLLRGKRNKTIETQHALSDVSFNVVEGEFFGIVGRNGGGKSTLLKLLAGIYHPTKGTVHTKGRIVPFIELGVGFNAELTGRENVYLNGSLLGFSENEIKNKYESIVEFAELERFMDQKLKNYSSGMQVRLAFSVATVLAESDILLIDEVLAVGDANFQRKCYEYFNNLKKINKTVVFVTHDMGAVEEFCDRAMLIEDGRVSMIGTSKDVANKYRRINFKSESETATADTDSKRWGNGYARIKTVQVRNENNKIGSEIISDKEFKVAIKVTYKNELEDPIVGFQLRDAAGTVVIGLNTKISGLPVTKRGNNETATYNWILPNVLKSGTYTVTASAHDYGGEPFDWWVDAKSFSVEKNEDTSALIMPAHKFNVTKE